MSLRPLLPGFIPPDGPAPEDASICYSCDKIPDEVTWEVYRSDEISWGQLAGREGYVAYCALHHEPVAENWTKVS